MVWNTFWSTSGSFFILNKIDIANYANDNMSYTNSNDVNGLLQSLKASQELF